MFRFFLLHCDGWTRHVRELAAKETCR